MNRVRWFLLGGLTLVVVAAALGAIWIREARGFSAREQPTVVERWIAEEARAMAVPREAVARRNPEPDTPEVLSEARAHWADHCATCHGNNGGGDTQMGRNTYPPAPDMRMPATQGKSDGQLFYIIQNGVRLSAMPAWGGSGHDEEDSWKLVRFIRHLPQLTTEEEQEMEKLNPKGPEDRKEEEEEERFLRGEDTSEPQTTHQH